MLIVSQNKEKLMIFGISFNGLEYGEDTVKNGRKEEIQHKIFITDGCLEEVGKYKSKERCLEILKEICQAYENERFSDYAYDQAAMVQRPYIFAQNLVYEMPEE